MNCINLLDKISQMYKPVLLAVFLMVRLMVAAQLKELPEEVLPFVTEGYEMLDYISGDVNADKKKDAVLILKIKGEDTTYEEVKRPFIILIRQADGKLKPIKRNDEAILCRQCGGVFGDPYEGIDVSDGGFEIHFYGGSAWRWASHYLFKYNAAKSNWYLVHEKQLSYHNLDIDKTMKVVNISSRELGEVPLDSFTASPSFVQQKWKVTADKTFFYNNPILKSKPRKGYLLKGDTVTSYREFTNFVDVYFENKKDKSSSGYILKKDLVKID